VDPGVFGIRNPEIADLCVGLLLTDKDGVIQTLHKLRELKATEALPYIPVCFSHPNRDVIHEAFHVMADIGNKDTIPLIEPSLNAERKEVRKEAQNAIKRLRNK
jgi:HEAT repeat protein